MWAITPGSVTTVELRAKVLDERHHRRTGSEDTIRPSCWKLETSVMVFVIGVLVATQIVLVGLAEVFGEC